MTDSASYSVVLSGNLKSGFDMEQVVDAFARLFKLPPEKASRIIGSEFVIKRDVNLPMARIYQEKLANIGIEVVLQPQADTGELTLEPMVTAESGDAGSVDSPLAGDEMICPKCQLRQPRAAECGGCGVIISKIPPPVEFTVKVEAAASQPGEQDSADHKAGLDGNNGATTARWIIVSALLAVLAALVWYAVV